MDVQEVWVGYIPLVFNYFYPINRNRMSILKEVEKNGAQFYVKTGKLLNGSENWAIVVQNSTIISIDDFQPEGFDALHQGLFLKEFKNSRHGFMVVDGKVRNLDIYLVDILSKADYNQEITNSIASARSQFSFFDVESGMEIKVGGGK